MSVTMLSKWNKLTLNCSLLHFMDLNCHHVQRGAPSNLTRGSFLFLFRLILFFFSLQHSEQLWKTHYAIHVCRWITDCRLHDLLACVTSVSVRFRSKERGARVKDQARNCSSKTFFGSRFISLAAKTKNPVPRSFFAPKPNGNACYEGYRPLKGHLRVKRTDAYSRSLSFFLPVFDYLLTSLSGGPKGVHLRGSKTDLFVNSKWKFL